MRTDTEKVAQAFYAADKGMTLKAAGQSWLAGLTWQQRLEYRGHALRFMLDEKVHEILRGPREKVFFGIDHASGVERVGEIYVSREAEGTKIHEMKIDGKTVYRSPGQLVAWLRDQAPHAPAEASAGLFEAAELIEKLVAENKDLQKSANSQTAAAEVVVVSSAARHGEELRQRDQILAAFEKFDHTDWGYVLGIDRAPHDSYRANSDGGRDREWKSALAVLRSIVEAAQPKPEKIEPSAEAKAFAQEWVDGPFRELAALAFDQAVAAAMWKTGKD